MGKYYTVSTEYSSINGGNVHAIEISKANSEGAALSHFQTLYGVNATLQAKVVEGIHIENGFNDLLTDYAKKVIVKILSGAENAPKDFSYTNRIYLNSEG